ncbi:hypothetical protein GSF08_02170 [Clostridiaceae bacterium DONG20-135]|uniref:YfcC family protein n=1 Tax=Copranaerobaculum intestinale TaxID=2692629 RepID=A0A6N8U3J7_9FIRM|nr:AbgT family transporter [Copranaerobaculum intestinale]MXQ72752.1 hypothetical protein [Copranaerobaculum intestinale]
MEQQDSRSSVKISTKSFLSSLAILVILVLIAGAMTQIIPQGMFDRVIKDGREVIVSGSYHVIHEAKYPLWHLITAPVEVLFSEDGLMISMIILFICAIGGSFAILQKSGVLTSTIALIVEKVKNHKYRIIPLVILFFMILGGVLGVFEEAIPLVPIIVTLSYSLGWDAMVGLGISLLATAFGFSAAMTNPFSIGVAQSIAGLPAFSGLLYRLLIFAVVYLILTSYILHYAKKIDKDPSKSLLYNSGSNHGSQLLDMEDNEQLKKARYFLLASFTVIFIVMLSASFVSVISDLSLPLVGLLFFLAGIGCGKIAGLRFKEVLKAFAGGIAGIAPGIILILLAMSVKFIISEGGIMDTILYSASSLISSSNIYAAGIFIFFLVLALNFFIGSATAKAFLVMPIITPLADLVGITRQTSVLAFCFGDGFSNVIFPTNPVLLIALGLTMVSYGKWFRFTYKLQLMLFAVSVIFIMLATGFAYGPF